MGRYVFEIRVSACVCAEIPTENIKIQVDKTIRITASGSGYRHIVFWYMSPCNQPTNQPTKQPTNQSTNK